MTDTELLLNEIRALRQEMTEMEQRLKGEILDAEARILARESPQLIAAIRHSQEEVLAAVRGLQETTASADGLRKTRQEVAAAFSVMAGATQEAARKLA